ncbi:uncharacterized protein FRV6_15333 [Fusarium oxysporum]|uniref:Uncharacterized protein n=1 Tax=Fusarium oxysporum TaxID=5507 RepID=A0A2H3TU62_FUSOX|nr:uncharacterized protein FRV6_15333 [Fusarium oxysporum]
MAEPNTFNTVTSTPFNNIRAIPLDLTKQLLQETGYVPDGETGYGKFLLEYQTQSLFPRCIREHSGPSASPDKDHTPASRAIAHLKENVIKTGYYVSTALNYQRFQSLRNSHIIPSGVKMLVYIPSPLSIASAFHESGYLSDIASIYKKGLLQDMEDLSAYTTEQTGHDHIAIQIDIGGELPLASSPSRHSQVFKKLDMMKTILEMICEINPSIEVGLHFALDQLDTSITTSLLETSIATVLHVLHNAPNRIKWLKFPLTGTGSVNVWKELSRNYEIISALKKQNVQLRFTQAHPEQAQLAVDRLERCGFELLRGKLQIEKKIVDLTGEHVQFCLQSMQQYESEKTHALNNHGLS